MATVKKIVFPLLLLSLVTSDMVAQQNIEQPCIDKVYLQDGSYFEGKIIEYRADSFLLLKTLNQFECKVPLSSVKKIRQKCPHSEWVRMPKLFDLQANTWWKHVRFYVMPGIHWTSSGAVGAGIQGVGGYQFSRYLGVGVGAGTEIFYVGSNDVITYPVFTELRGHLTSGRKTSPYYVVGAGWAFAGNVVYDEEFSNQITRDWRGGWLSQVKLGLLMGSRLSLDVGLRWQRKTRHWVSRWGGTEGKDNILHQRLEIGIGWLF